MRSEDLDQQKRLSEGATAALIRAAQKARELARRTGTPIVVVRDGELISEIPKDEPVDKGRAQGA